MGALAGAGRPSLLPVRGDGMLPTLRPGDLVAVAPVGAWRGDGLYLIDTGGGPELLRCASDLSGGIRATRDNPAYRPFTMTSAEFAASVRGQVWALVHVVESSLLEAMARPAC
jgi:phage repressor protein C with HTH and peptisase S24 domain